MRRLLSWGAIGVVVPTLLFAGIGVLALGNVSTEDYIIAKICFLLICLIFALKVIEWGSERGDWMSYLSVFLVCGVLGIIALGFVHYVNRKRDSKPQESKSTTSPASSPTTTAIEPKFADDIEWVRVTVNDNELPQSINMLEKYGIDLNKAPTNIPGRLYIEGRRPYFDGEIKVGIRRIQIRRNRIVDMPSGWDENFNDRAYEVVNDRLRVVFQFVLKSAEHIEIDAGQYINDDSMWRERIFRYPSSQHPGEFDSKTKLIPLSAKSLYQLFLTDCKGGSSRTQRVLGKQSGNEFKVERVICRNRDTRSSHLIVFIPQANPEPVILALASEYQDIIDEEDRAGFGEGTVFTRLVVIYHEGFMFERQIKPLKEEFEKHGATVRFHGQDDVIMRNSPLYQQ